MKRISFFILVFAGIAVFCFAQGEPFKQEGIASWYGQEFAGRPTASGEIFNPGLLTAAHPTLPFGTVLTVTNKQNMRQVKIRVNDRGPFVSTRIIDLSRAAAEVLDMLITGTAPVSLEQSFDTENLGPMAVSAAGKAPPVVVPSSVTPSLVEAPPLFETVSPIETAPPAVVLETPQTVSKPYPAGFPPEEKVKAPVLPVQPAALVYPAPAAVILGSIPPENSAKSYRLQVGSFKVPKNAIDVFEKLKNAGLNPNYERNGDFYRVVLAGLKAKEIPSVAQTLGNTGFREAIIREEN
jgi:rare lipoprotein A